jgi:hemolysin III
MAHVVPNETTHVGYLDPADERANVLTHLLGFLLSLLAMSYLLRVTATLETGFRICCLVFATTMAAVYLFSTLSHAVYSPSWRHRFRAWDQGTIYLMIVGTYSPFIWQATSGWGRVALLTAVWTAAGVGFLAKVIASHRVNAVATISYLALGWLPTIPLISNTPMTCLLWMLWGGLCYSLGVIFLNLSHNIRFTHAVWHLMVIAGSACHFWAILILIDLAGRDG